MPFTVDLQFYRLTPDGRSLLLVAADPAGKALGSLPFDAERTRDARVGNASDGRIGFLHMAMPEDLSAYGDLFSRYRQTEAVLVDVRLNRGGNLHDPLVAMFTDQRVAELITRDGVPIAEIPVSRRTRPSALIANAGSYSDGSVFPALYQQLKIGPLLGESVPGTGTAVWWEKLLDRRLEYGVPQLGFWGRDGRFFENQEIVPDSQPSVSGRWRFLLCFM